MIYTFDIFDTLLIRRFYDHRGIFSRMGQILKKEPGAFGVDACIARDFAALREYAGLEAPRRLGREATFEDIYELIGQYAGVEGETIARLMELEIETEIAWSAPIAQNIALVREHIRQNHTVALLSDMYHHPGTLKRMLGEFAPDVAECEIMVSAHAGGSKASGALFQACMAHYQVAPHEITHFGDNGHGDYRVPRSLGVHVLSRFKNADRGYYPSFLYGFCGENTLFDAYIGASRTASVDNKFDAAEKIGCFIAGPLLYAFAEWVVERAVEEDRQTLFFLARDGLLLERIAQRIISRRKYRMETRYLHVSRVALARCLATPWGGVPPEALDVAFFDDGALTLSEIGWRLGVREETWQGILDVCKISHGLHVPLSARKIGVFRSLLERDAAFVREVAGAAAKERALLLAYLGESGFTFSDAALVDVGWKGTIQDMLWRIGQLEGLETCLSGFYFGLCAFTRWQGPGNKKHGFVFEPHGGRPHPWEHNGVFSFMEIFCSHLEHGQTLGYAPAGCGVRPLHGPVRDDNRVFLVKLQRGMDAFSDAMLAIPRIEGDPASFAGRYLQLLLTPDAEMAECLGAYRHYTGVHDIVSKEFAPPLSICAIAERALFGMRHDDHWFEGSVRRGGRAARFLWSFYGRHKKRLGLIKKAMRKAGRYCGLYWRKAGK